MGGRREEGLAVRVGHELVDLVQTGIFAAHALSISTKNQLIAVSKEVLDDLALRQLLVQVAVEFRECAPEFGCSLPRWIDEKLEGAGVVADRWSGPDETLAGSGIAVPLELPIGVVSGEDGADHIAEQVSLHYPVCQWQDVHVGALVAGNAVSGCRREHLAVAILGRDQDLFGPVDLETDEEWRPRVRLEELALLFTDVEYGVVAPRVVNEWDVDVTG